jgi:isoleucyl-tRNA synthetase
MYSVNQPGESKNFDEKTVALLSQQVFGLLYNVLSFYELYRDKKLENNNRPKSKNVLDVWILSRLDELVKLTTENLDNYKLLEPTRAMRDFIGDLSTWYLRRSRERIKEGEEDAKQTLYFVLKTLAKLLAPFAPFSAEDIWLKLRNESDKESVHLAEWPALSRLNFDNEMPVSDMQIAKMNIVRNLVSLGLKERQKAGIPVRQPLPKISVLGIKLERQYKEIIKDELNVKDVIESGSIKNEVELDTNITPELKAEGDYRELLRAIQDMRKGRGLTPSDMIILSLETNDAGKELIQKFESDMKKVVLASRIELKENNGGEIKINDLVFKVKIDKIQE